MSLSVLPYRTVRVFPIDTFASMSSRSRRRYDTFKWLFGSFFAMFLQFFCIFHIILLDTLAIGAGLLIFSKTVKHNQKLLLIFSCLVEQRDILGIANAEQSAGSIHDQCVTVATTIITIMIVLILLFFFS